MVSRTPPCCSSGWLRKRFAKCPYTASRRGVSRRASRFSISSSSRSRSDNNSNALSSVTGQFKKQFQRVGDVRLRLAFEKAFVAALAETCCGFHDELGVGGERDAAVASQVVTVRRRPLR